MTAEWVQAIGTVIAALAIIYAVFNGRDKQARLRVDLVSSYGNFGPTKNKDLIEQTLSFQGTLINHASSAEGIANIYLCIRSPKQNHYVWHAIPPFTIEIDGVPAHKTQIYLQPRQAVHLKISLHKWQIGKDVLRILKKAMEDGSYMPWEILFQTSSDWYFNQHGKLIDFTSDKHKWAINQNTKASPRPEQALRYEKKALNKARLIYSYKRVLRFLGLV